MRNVAISGVFKSPNLSKFVWRGRWISFTNPKFVCFHVFASFTGYRSKKAADFIEIGGSCQNAFRIIKSLKVFWYEPKKIKRLIIHVIGIGISKVKIPSPWISFEGRGSEIFWYAYTVRASPVIFQEIFHNLLCNFSYQFNVITVVPPNSRNS